MSALTKILACVDLSQFSGAILDYAAEIAWRKESEIIVLNVINQRDIDHVEDVHKHYYFLGNPERNVTANQYLTRERELRSAELEALVAKHLGTTEAKVETQIETGFPHKAILKTAEKEQSDIIVMGHKGKGNFTDTFLGSIALRVLRRSSVPVLNVR